MEASIKCGKCGKENTFDKWTRDGLGQDLPPNVFQCPDCKIAIRREIAPNKYGWPTVTITFCQPFL